jgi:predicted metal-dependent phosphoesterase TrpH
MTKYFTAASENYISSLHAHGAAKLALARKHRDWRASQILEKLNVEFDKEGIPRFTPQDMKNIQDSVDGSFGRPHIANYLIQKGIVKDKQEAFDKSLQPSAPPFYSPFLEKIYAGNGLPGVECHLPSRAEAERRSGCRRG